MVLNINTGGKIVRVKVKDFNEEIEIEDLLKIDPSKASVQMLVFPAILNRLGIMLEEAKFREKERKIDLEVYEAKLSERLRSDLLKDKARLKLTADDIRSQVKADTAGDAKRLVKTKLLLKAEKETGYLSSIYWAAKETSDNLRKVSDKIKPEDFIMEELENSLYEMKIFEPLIR